MKKLKLLLGFFLVSLLITETSAQDGGKKKLEQDFEKYKQDREFDFQKFKKQREEELKKMQEEYQDYYNSMMGLKKYYVEKKDTAKANAVDDIISFEKNVSTALGKPIKVTEQVVITPANEEKVEVVETPQQQTIISKDDEKIVQQNNQNEAKNKPVVANEEIKTETTFTPLPTDGNTIPILTPVPKAKSKITSPFGVRMHPTLHRPIKHNGVDFGSGRSADVYASANGKVILAEYNRSFGNYIIVEHKDGTSSLYAHLEKITTAKGQQIKKGDLIGYTGSTGRSSGPHLHYEVRVSGIPVNPQGYLKEIK
ncbi:hypothetical protein CYCD_09420 [Tenuifilaceae bacterium CYCD]|nr:hypothetical protein CYCD_09420 [Tenuifilaceae bacterium CYCD]